MSNFKQQNVIVTGGVQGIGASIAKQFSATGANVFVLDRQAQNSTQDIQYRQCDISQREQVFAHVQAIQQQVGQIHTLICNAGDYVIKPIQATTEKDLQQVFNTNVFGTYYCVQAVLANMQHHNFGRIVLIGSDQALVGLPYGTAYGMSKAAVVQLTESLSTELAGQYNIRVNCLCPSTVADTQMTEQAAEFFAKEWAISIEQVYERFAAELPHHKMISKDSVARWALHLSDPNCDDINGAVIPIDGGFTRIR